MHGKLDVMIDLETTGTCHYAGILTIGAVVVQDLDRKFYRKVDPKTLEPSGFVIQPDTMNWWNTQDPKVKAEAFSGTQHINDAIQDLVTWLRRDVGIFHPWSNAASFDLSLIKDACDKFGILVPWKFWDEMCYRTFKNTFKAIPFEKPGDAHNALSDAIAQAKHLKRIFEYARTV